MVLKNIFIHSFNFDLYSFVNKIYVDDKQFKQKIESISKHKFNVTCDFSEEIN